MSLKFSDTANKSGIIQLIEDKLGFDDAFISGDATRLAKWTAKVNLALDRAFTIIFHAGGTWQFDDSNHEKSPIINTNLVASQRDYSFTVDQQNNLVLDIYKVFLADSSGVFSEIMPVDVQSGASNDAGGGASGRLSGSGGSLSGFTDGRNATGTPYRYDKTANGIFLDPIPNYNYTNGLKIYINREGSYFTVSDTTKKAGIAGLFHEYLVIQPIAEYAMDKTLTNADRMMNRVLIMEKAMAEYYGQRERDVRKRLIPSYENNR